MCPDAKSVEELSEVQGSIVAERVQIRKPFRQNRQSTAGFSCSAVSLCYGSETVQDQKTPIDNF